MALLLYGLYLFLAVYAAGNMVTLQIQHYGIYPFVGKEAFGTYMQANNKAALLPSILPATLLLLVSGALLVVRPAFMSGAAAASSLGLNLAAFVSTFLWQRRIQAHLAVRGYQASEVRRLLATNWIRTGLYLVQAGLAVAITLRALSR